MITMLVLLLLLCPAGALATPTTYEFHGLLGQGTVDGTFQYQSAQPSTMNQNGWVNQVFAPTSWFFTVVNNWAPLPGTAFSSTLVVRAANGVRGRACSRLPMANA